MALLEGLWDDLPKTILGAVVGVALEATFGTCRRVVVWWHRRKLVGLFGKDVLKAGALHLVFSPLKLSDTALEALQAKGPDPARWPYIKEAQSGCPGRLGNVTPVSAAELRAVHYITAALRDARVPAPELVDDESAIKHQDRSFVALGGPSSNLLTRRALDPDKSAPVRLDWHNGHPVLVSPEGQCLHRATSDYDHGFILRVCPSQQPSRVWIVCAGHGETGTAGAAYYLAKNWQRLSTDHGRERQWCVLVKVPVGEDTAAVAVEKDPKLPIANGKRPKIEPPMPVGQHYHGHGYVPITPPVSGSPWPCRTPFNQGTADYGSPPDHRRR